VKFGPVTPELTELIILWTSGRLRHGHENWRISSDIAGYTEPIFAVFSPHESALHADDGSVTYFSICQWTLPWQPNNVAVLKENRYYVHSLHVCQMAARFWFATTCYGAPLRCQAGYTLDFATHF